MFSPVKFKKDLARGNLFEDFVAEDFTKRGWSVKRAKGNTPGWDLIITKGNQTFYVECKFDEMSDRTGNYALEFKSLNQTKSDLLVIGTPKEAYIIPMTSARDLFNNYPHRQVGDFYDNFAALVPKIVIQHYFKRL